MAESKTIQITNITSRQVNTKYGPKPVYQVVGNDGKTYETFDSDFMKTLRVGTQTEINYEVTSTSGTGGRVYTNYRLITKEQKAPGTSSSNSEVMDALRKTYQKLVEVEKNVLAYLEMSNRKPGLVDPESIYLNPNSPEFNQEEEITYVSDQKDQSSQGEDPRTPEGAITEVNNPLRPAGLPF